MVMLYNKSRGGFKQPFFAPADDASGGSSGASKNGGGQDGGDTIVSPFKNLPWDELDDESKASLKKAETEYVATLQQLKTDLGKQTELAGKFQSEADRLKAEQGKHQQQQQQQRQEDPYFETIKQELLTAGYPEADAIRMAPVFTNMFKKVGVLEREKLGKDLAPMGATVLQGQAQDAFQTAVSVDPIGLFQSDEVKQTVWAAVVERTKEGLQTTPEFVLNLGKIVWADKLVEKRSKGEEITFPNASASTPTPVRGSPQFTFPGVGASFSPTASPPSDPNAAKTVLNDDTLAALAATFKAMGGETGLFPKGLKETILKPRR